MTSRTPAQVGKANRRAGIELERATVKELARSGWFAHQTGSGISTPVDVIAIRGRGRFIDTDSLTWLVQCKTSGYVAPAERRALGELAEAFCSHAVIAYWHKDGRKARTVKFRDLEGNEVQP